MRFANPYWTTKERIDLLQRWILTHSYLYYELDSSIVSDEMFDKNCKQLMEYKNKFKKSYKRSRYYYAMKDFDGSTGFGFYNKLDSEHYDNITRDANNLKERNEL